MCHVDLPIDTQVTHLITVRILFIHKTTTGIVNQTKPRKGTRHSANCFAHT